jgi:lactoylglutathione lyase
MPLLQRIEHIGIQVQDLDRSIAFYRDVLGLTLHGRRTFGSAELAFLAAEGDSALLELVARPENEPRGDGAVHHLAFTVAALEAVTARLREHGVALESDAPIAIWDGMRVQFFRGPDGELLELFERPNT